MRVVSFFSYKGGVGRTTLLANVAAFMAFKAQRRKRVACVDLDITAPGLDIAFDVQDRLPEHFVSEFLMGHPIPPSQMCIEIAGGPSEEGEEKLFLFPLPRGPRQEIQVIDAMDLFLEDLVKMIEDDLGCDYIFLDARSGFSREAGPVWLASDKVCLVTRCSYQHLEGVREMIGLFDRLNEARSDRTLEQIVVINDVPDDMPEDRQREVNECSEELGAVKLAENRELRWRDRVVVLDTTFRNALTNEQHAAFLRGCQQIAGRVIGDA